MNQPVPTHPAPLRRSKLRTVGALALAAAGLSALPFSASTLLADVTVRIDLGAPPPPRVEVQGARPGPEYVWIAGFWDGPPGHYSWSAGHWDRPPHPNAHWTSPHYEKDSGGKFHRVEGGWR
jgi:hypothetical protein